MQMSVGYWKYYANFSFHEYIYNLYITYGIVLVIYRISCIEKKCIKLNVPIEENIPKVNSQFGK